MNYYVKNILTVTLSKIRYYLGQQLAGILALKHLIGNISGNIGMFIDL